MKKGNVNLTTEMPKELRDELKILAIKKGIGLREMVISVLEDLVEKNKK